MVSPGIFYGPLLLYNLYIHRNFVLVLKTKIDQGHIRGYVQFYNIIILNRKLYNICTNAVQGFYTTIYVYTLYHKVYVYKVILNNK